MEVINSKMHNDQRVIILPEGKKWETILKESLRPELEILLPAYLRRCRWFGGKAKTITEARIIDAPALPGRGREAYLLTVAVSYQDAPDERYLLPLSQGTGEAALKIKRISPSAILARIHTGPEKGILYDSSCDPVFMENCFDFIAREEKAGETTGRLRRIPGKALLEWIKEGESLPKPKVLQKEQSNTSFVYGDDYIFKLYRRLTDGINPEVEMIRFLTEDAGFTHIAPFAGLIERNYPNSFPVTIGLLQSFVQHIDDGWTYSLERAGYCFDHLPPETPGKVKRTPTSISIRGESPPGLPFPSLQDWIGEEYLGDVELLGRRTAQLHQALASKSGIPAFAPEPYSLSDREEQLRSALSLLEETLLILEKTEKKLPPTIRAEARRIREKSSTFVELLHQIIDQSSPGMKIRIHGDYHLGQILRTGDDFVIIDFEGEPARSIAERRRKRSPLVDVAGMIRSFHYAAYGAIFLGGDPDPERILTLSSWAEDWYHTVSGAFLRSYLETMSRGKADLLPANPEDLKRLLEIFLLEKAIYELNYELNNRPEWVIIPLRGIILT